MSEKIKLTNGQLEIIMKSNVLKSMMDDKEIPALLRWGISRFVKEASPYFEDFTKFRDEIYSKYANKYEKDVYDENNLENILHKQGDVIIINDDNGNQMLTFSGDQTKLINEINSLVLDVKTFNLDRITIDRETTTKYLSANDMILMDLIADIEV